MLNNFPVEFDCNSRKTTSFGGHYSPAKGSCSSESAHRFDDQLKTDHIYSQLAKGRFGTFPTTSGII
jgi:hypothetical protein